jgi:uracil-DNA glycosylase family 4
MATALPRALPHLDERQTAMLAEMGIAPWWAPRALLPQPRMATAADERAPEPPVLRRPPAATPATPPAVPPAPPSQPAVAQPPLVPSAPVGIDDAGALDIGALDWDALHAAIHACQRCALAGCRQRAVPGVGDPRPDWLIVGEAPGEEEDRQGEPFVGRAGQLLDRMLAAMGLRRGQGVYIANVIKCRPPRNRNPEPDEIARCTPYLLRQIALLQPRLVLAMGRFAAQTLLAEGGCDRPDTLLRTPLGRLRGRVYTARLAGLALPVVVTYHPAYLLRNPADKAKAWADLCLALDAAEALHRAAPGAAAGIGV